MIHKMGHPVPRHEPNNLFKLSVSPVLGSFSSTLGGSLLLAVVVLSEANEKDTFSFLEGRFTLAHMNGGAFLDASLSFWRTRG